MSASEYWDKAEWLMNEHYQDGPSWRYDLVSALIDIGWVKPNDRMAVLIELAKHDQVWAREDIDADCKCGKWLEENAYEWPDHFSTVLGDLGLLEDPDWTPTPPRQTPVDTRPVPAAFQFPRRAIDLADWLP